MTNKTESKVILNFVSIYYFVKMNKIFHIQRWTIKACHVVPYTDHQYYAFCLEI